MASSFWPSACNSSFRRSNARLKTTRGRPFGGSVVSREFESLEERRLLSISPTDGQLLSQLASVGTVAGHSGQGQISPAPVALTAEEQAVITACMTDTSESPLRPSSGDGQLSDVAASQTPAAVNAPAAAVAAQSNNPDAFTIAQLTPLPSSATGGLTSDVGEPALGTLGNAVLQTGNWYASVSDDQGKTFEFINPFTNFGNPSTDPLGSFCCDQRVAQVPSLGLTIWYLQYEKGVRIAVFDGADNLVNDRWTIYNWTAASFNLAAGAELDYPTLEVTNNYLYASSNVFDSGSTNSVVWRMPLSQLAAGGTTHYDWWTSVDSSICLAADAGSRMYMGALESSNTFRVFWVDDSSNQLFSQLETGLGTTYITGEGGHTAVGPDGNNWLARDDERVKTAWITGNTVGFMWDSAQGTNRPYPFVRALTVDASTSAVTAQPDIWSNVGAYAYPAIAVNSRGAIGGPVFFGSPTVAPELATLIDDDLSPPISTSGWQNYLTATGTHGDPLGWGDFLSAVPNSAIANTWAAVGFTLNGSPVAAGIANPNLQPYFYTFGRGRDFPVIQAAPVVTTTPAALTYRVGSLTTAVDPGVTISDTGVSTLASVTVSITAGFVNGEDALSYSDPTGGKINGAISANGQTVTLTAAAGQNPSLLDFQNAARAVVYADQSANPTLGMRTATFTADNGAASNNTGSAVRSIIVTNVAAGSWMPLGPAPIFAGQTSGSLSVSGRITGVAADASSADTLYLAAAGGGVWKTTNATSANVVWTPLTDNLTDGSGNPLPLFMGAIAETDAISGAHAGNQIVYAGTGEANNSLDSFYGEGILVSTDGGANWTLETAGGDFSGRTVSKIVIDPADRTGATAYAAVAGFASNGTNGSTGIWKTTDFGATWANTTAANGLASTDEWSDVAIDPHSPATLYAADGNYFGGSGNGVYKSANGGATWTLLNGTGAVNGAQDGRIALAVYDDGATNELFVSIAYPTSSETLGGQLYKMLKSTNGGSSFTDLTANVPAGYMGATSGGKNYGQGWYDTTLIVNPNNANFIYAGGSDNGSSGGNVESFNGGATWQNITSDGHGNGPHSDDHAVAFDANGNLVDGDDGGIFRLNSTANAAAQAWQSLNTNLQITQFTGIAVDPTVSNVAYGGSQDNGTEKYTGSAGWSLVAPGDGGIARIDPANHNVVFQEYTGVSLSISTDGGASFNGITNGILANASDDYDPTVSEFYVPYVLDSAGNVYYGTDRLNLSKNLGVTWSQIGTPGVNNFNAGDSAIAVIAVAPGNNNVVYVSAGGHIFITTNAQAGGPNVGWTQVDLPGGASAEARNSLVVDPSDPTGGTAYAVVDRFTGGGNHVFKTTNFGVTWTDISASLLDTPVESIAVSPDGKTVYVGTDVGVYSSGDGGTSWSLVGSGMPQAQVVELQLVPSQNLLAAGTHGRGMFEISLSTTNVSDTVTNPVPLAIVPAEGSAFNEALAAFNGSNSNGTKADFTATIDWGDGSPLANGVISGTAVSGYTVSAAHTYAEEAHALPLKVFVKDSSGNVTTIGNNTSVADAPLASAAAGLTPPVAAIGVRFSNVGVFHFTDANPNAAAADYTATITLGDGNFASVTSQPSGTGQIVVDPNGGFDVQLSYAYAAPLSGATFGVSVADVGGAGTSQIIHNFSVATPFQAAFSVGNVSGTPGGQITVPIELSDGSDNIPSSDAVQAIQAVVTYDPGVLTIGSVSAGSLLTAGGQSWQVQSYTDDNGSGNTLVLNAVSTAGLSGDFVGDAFGVTFTINAGASGSTNVYVDASTTDGKTTTYVALADNSELTLNPAPANGPSDPVFATVAVLSQTDAPQITSANSTTFTASISTFTVTTTGAPTPTITASGTLPQGVTLTDNRDGSATLASTAATPAGVYQFAIDASNGVLPDATQNFTLTVMHVNLTPNQRFISNVYRDLLGREVDPGALTALTNAMSAGLSRDGLLAIIEQSIEYDARVIQQLYQRYLHRAAEAAAENGLLGMLQNGETIEQLSAILVTSQEFYVVQGRGTSDGFLEAVYQDALDRPIDAGAETALNAAMSNGATRAQVVDLVLTSNEYLIDVIEQAYQELLHRPAESAAVEYWLGKLTSGSTDQQMDAAIASSDEYFARTG